MKKNFLPRGVMQPVANYFPRKQVSIDCRPVFNYSSKWLHRSLSSSGKKVIYRWVLREHESIKLSSNLSGGHE